MSFTILNGPDCGYVFDLGDTPLTIGRDQDRHVTLNDDRASRAHARLEPEGDHAVVEDLDSSNGTYVNDALITRQPLRAGDVILIGHTRIGVNQPGGAFVARPAKGTADAPTKRLNDISASKTIIQ